MWVDELVLIKESEGLNENGFTKKTEIGRKTVYGNRKSVKASEFYKSAMAGIKVDAVFEVKECDYDGEQIILFEKKKYKIVRDYSISYSDSIELSVTDITEAKDNV